MKTISLKFIKWYQKYLSPDHSSLAKYYPYGYCRFRPTCSQYTYDAISKYGFIKGWMLGWWRMLRCNPWSKGGYDPVK